MHSLAQPAHEAARCAGAVGKYWPYHDRLFERQPRVPPRRPAAVCDGARPGSRRVRALHRPAALRRRRRAGRRPGAGARDHQHARVPGQRPAGRRRDQRRGVPHHRGGRAEGSSLMAYIKVAEVADVGVGQATLVEHGGVTHRRVQRGRRPLRRVQRRSVRTRTGRSPRAGSRATRSSVRGTASTSISPPAGAGFHPVSPSPCTRSA